MSKGTGTPLINKKGSDQRQRRKARKENTMTNREFFTAIAAMENLNEELIQHAEAELEKLNKRNAARAAKPTKAQKENESIKEEIVKFLTERVVSTLQARLWKRVRFRFRKHLHSAVSWSKRVR